MSDPAVFWLLAAMLALVVVLGAGALVLRHKARQVQRLLAVSQEKLEQLQRQFEHFVPADVVEQLTGGQGIYAPRRCAATSDRKSTRLNSSHQIISYAVFCLKKKKKEGRRQACNPGTLLDLQ